MCINTLGSYDCRCKDGFFGNPFVGCQQVQVGPCADPSTCICSNTAPCPFDYICVNHKCINQCSDIKCGPRSVCQNGVCVCPPGYSGNPNDLHKGCHLHGHCLNDLECEPQEICFQVGKGVRKCVDACSKLQCGPNALCITQNHVSSCLCIDGYQGNPSNLIEGCQPSKSVIPGCVHDSDCPAGAFCITLDGGVRDCVNPCNKVVCGAYQKCEPDLVVPGHATCKCQDGYEWNPVQSSCEKPSVPDCITDDDCHSSEGCRPDALGVLKCVSLCDGFTCTANSRCVMENHHGRCDCLPGYIGNPNDRRGCHSPRENRCSTDSECAEDQTCRSTPDGPLACQLICDFITCGPNALCVVNNHVANCECPPGQYAGDPNDSTSGCRAVPCVYNIDCPPAQLCNRLTHTCYDACDENACGVNAVCIAEDHKAICQCPPGLRPNPVPDVECVAVEACHPDSCHPTALCVAGPTNNPVCQCPPNHVGDPYVNGCQPEGHCSSPKDCPVHSVCHEHRCINPCENACGPNAFCEIVNDQPSCKCIHRFVPSSSGPEHGCVRGTNYCTVDAQCEDSYCIDGQCRGNPDLIDKQLIIMVTFHYIENISLY